MRLITGMGTSLRVRPLVLVPRQRLIETACNLMGAVVVYLFLYESSDISLENVDMVRA